MSSMTETRAALGRCGGSLTAGAHSSPRFGRTGRHARVGHGLQVAIDYQSSIYWITSVTPSAQTWEDGDRQIVCALKLGEEGEEMTGSAEGTGR